MSKIGEFLAGAGTFYLATADGDQPKIRPLGMFLDGDDYVRFGIGTFKDCWKQMEKNPKVEIVACQGAHWLRYTGKAVIDTDPKYVEEALEKNPGLKNIYNEQTGNVMGI
ncbi:MAG: pyridoxamine 5'-phosphate oxidase family protein, partial [Lachnospiraceae bacterium]|nr:pyridoxamine 5'-phosphate oxidase family protein [Lachnospiraceae bacterium]